MRKSLYTLMRFFPMMWALTSCSNDDDLPQVDITIDYSGATEVDGVAAMAGDVQKELVSKLGMKVLSKGVRIAFEDSGIRVDLSIILEYGCSIPEVTAAVQERVKNSIETMTGLKVVDVNIRVADVKIDNE